MALARVKVVLSLTTHLTRSFCLLSPCDGLGVVGNNLTWCHGAKDEVLIVPLEAILICTYIMHGALVELPWSSITLNRIPIGANLERYLDLLVNLDAPGVA